MNMSDTNGRVSPCSRVLLIVSPKLTLWFSARAPGHGRDFRTEKIGASDPQPPEVSDDVQFACSSIQIQALERAE